MVAGGIGVAAPEFSRSAEMKPVAELFDVGSERPKSTDERADAVATLRKVIGATDPAEAEAGTVRKRYAESKERNAIHASDSDENARREATFFFPEADLV